MIEQRITIKEVAELAGLSRATVSRVINNYPHISEDKKRAVKNAMEQLGYYPNSSARRLRNRKTETIAVLINRITNPFFSKLIEAMEIAAMNSGYQLIVCQTRYSKTRELQYLDMLKAKKVDGIILASIENDWSEIEPYQNFGPLILVNEFHREAKVPTIYADQVIGGYIAVKHLLDLGHEHIAYCIGDLKTSVGKGRMEGLIKAHEEFGKHFDEHALFKGVYTVEDGKKAFHQLPKKITAVFVGGDEAAAGIIAEAKLFGVRVPEDLSVVGFDDQPISELIDPAITTVHQPIGEMGEQAVKVMIEKINNDDAPLEYESYVFPLQLVERNSATEKR
ncbi:LacI family DNA-binding transcriptional regulator [Cytobacillus oceanisediminis]|uniref:LacI family DNA-binding transcriptional regulator n=1 Tax=Cytobacillus oceanisediminis TaxID=665099 RepID=UPI0021B67E4E|nr:LacI family DNA-binding transcriptional regulator [Cytobacillus oceanisediminis]